MIRNAGTILVASGLLAAVANAQTPGELNRSIAGVAVRPADGLSYTILIYRSYAATGTVDLSNEVHLSINGSVVAVIPDNQTYSGSSNGCSDNDACAGCSSGFSCFVGVPVLGCACGALTAIPAGEFPIPPGANITASIAPAGTGDPERYTDDDVREIIFNGEPSYWNRSVSNVRVVPTVADGPAFFDVYYDLTLETNNVQQNLDLSTDVDILVNGRVVDTQRHVIIATPPDGTGCGIGCTTTQACICQTIPSGQTICYCAGFVWGGQSGPEPLQPGDEITVILRPAPGALPELPGLGGDDSDTPGGPCGDFDGDGDTDGSDFTVFVQCFGGSNNPPAGTCPIGVDADLDNDGDVDALDFVMFTQCFTGAL